MDAELRKYAGTIEGLHKAAVEADPEAAFYVFSDHGMTPIAGTFDLMGAIEALGWNAPRDYLALYDSTMARFWFFREEARAAIAGKLASLECGRVVSPAERKAWGIDFRDNRFGDLVFLMNEGRLMHPSHMGKAPWPGMHGFDPRASSSAACLLARRDPPVAVSGLCDLFSLMMREAGLG